MPRAKDAVSPGVGTVTAATRRPTWRADEKETHWELALAG
jgi:hypothetical protein